MRSLPRWDTKKARSFAVSFLLHLYPTRCTSCAAVCLGLAVCLGCLRPTRSEQRLAEAYDAFLAYNIENVGGTARQHLLEHPESAVGHFLLGWYFLHRQTPSFTAALGELEFAQNLFEKHRDLEALSTRVRPNEFVGLIHRERALVWMKYFYLASQSNLPPERLQKLLQLAEQEIERGLASDPNSDFLRAMKDTLRLNHEEIHSSLPEPSLQSPRGVDVELPTQALDGIN